MKLRNKKTGEIIESACIGVFRHQSSGECERVDTEARSLEKVLEDWEDYEQKEPLIKDEKIRHIVLAWSSVYSESRNKEVKCIQCYQATLLVATSNCLAKIALPVIPELRDLNNYTIEELCGVEE